MVYFANDKGNDVSEELFSFPKPNGLDWTRWQMELERGRGRGKKKNKKGKEA